MDYSERIFSDPIPADSLHLHCVGKRLNASMHRYGPVIRENYWLIYLIQGEGRCAIDGIEFTLHAGCLFAGFPGQTLFYEAAPNSIWSIRWVCVNSPAMPLLLSSVGLTPVSPVIRPRDPEKILHALAALYDNAESDSVSSVLESRELFYRLLAAASPAESKFDSGPDAIDRSIRFMKHFCDQNIQIEDIAEYLHLERSYFSRLFRKRIGVTPKQWLTAYRMEKAAALLKSSCYTVGEIAASVGFEDQLYFSRVFRQHYHTSPSDYRLQT